MSASETIATAVEQALLARGGRQRGDEIAFACLYPDRHANGDAHPSASYNRAKRVWLCRVCGEKGGWVALSKLLGIASVPPPRARAKHGLTVAQLARAKAFTVDELAAFGVTDPTDNGTPCVLIQYRDRDGATVHVKKRLKLNGKGMRFFWPEDTLTMPYGLERLASLNPAAPIVIVEGESDCWTLWLNGFAALGIPGAENWKPKYAALVAGHPLYVWKEPGSGGPAFVAAVLRDLPDAKVMHGQLTGPKDVNELWLSSKRDRTAFGDSLRARMAVARSPRDDAGEGAPLLTALAAALHRFVVLTTAAADASALWVMHTHALAAAEVTPYLHITSPEKRSGKTRLLEVLALLVARPWLTGRVSPAVLSRKIDDVEPTLLLDESDAAFRSGDDYAEALRGVLNTGYQRIGAVSVCVGQGADMTYKDFRTFSAKAIAGIGRLPDTVEDRSIRIALRRRSSSEPVERFRRKKIAPEADAFRARLEAWTTAHSAALAVAEPTLPDELDDRAADVWEPLLAIADAAGGEWPERARRAARALSGGDARDEASDGIRLLADARTAFGADADRLSTVDLIAALVADEEAPWSEWHKGKPINPHGLAKLLKQYGLTPRSIRIADGTPKGYLREQFADAWARYLPGPSAQSGSNSATVEQPSNDGPEGVAEALSAASDVADEMSGSANADGPCGDVADAGPEYESGTPPLESLEDQMFRAALDTIPGACVEDESQSGSPDSGANGRGV